MEQQESDLWKALDANFEKVMQRDPRPCRLELIVVIAAHFWRSQAVAESWLLSEFGGGK